MLRTQNEQISNNLNTKLGNIFTKMTSQIQSYYRGIIVQSDINKSNRRTRYCTLYRKTSPKKMTGPRACLLLSLLSLTYRFQANYACTITIGDGAPDVFIRFWMRVVFFVCSMLVSFLLFPDSAFAPASVFLLSLLL